MWKNQIKEITKKENDWDHKTEARVVERPIEKITRKNMAIAIKVMKPDKVFGPSEVCAELITASGESGITVMTNFANVS